MNPVIEHLNSAGEWALSHAGALSWQMTVLVSLILAIDVLAARYVRAVVRHAWWLLVPLKLVLPPGLALPTSPAYWLPNRWFMDQKLAEPANPALDVVQYSTTYLPARGADEIPSRNLSAAKGAPALGVSLPGAWLLLWCSGCAFLAVMLSIRMGQVRRLVNRADDATPELISLLGVATAMVRLKRQPRLLISESLQSPSVCGWFAPVILLPRALAGRLTDTQLREILLHELAHIRRGDLWWNHFQAVVQILYWWHPLVWLANMRMRQVREEATDEAVVVTLRGQADSYASTLVEVARGSLQRTPIRLGFLGIIESKNALRRRVCRILTRPIPRRSSLGFAGLLSVLMGGLILLPMARGTEPGNSQIQAGPGITSAASNDGRRDRKPDRTTSLALAPYDEEAPRLSFAPPRIRPKTPGQKAILEKLDRIRLNDVSFDNLPLSEVVRILRDMSTASDPSAVGVNFVLNPYLDATKNSPKVVIDPNTGAEIPVPAPEPIPLEDVIIRVKPPISDVRMSDVIDAVVRSASARIQATIEDYAVVFMHFSTASVPLVTRVFRLNPGSVEQNLVNLKGLVSHGTSLLEHVSSLIGPIGVSMAPAKAAFYNDRLGLLMVRATEEEILGVEHFVELLNSAPAMIEFETHLLEIPSARLPELGFDDILSSTPKAGTNAIILSDAQARVFRKACEQRPDIRALAAPRITTLDRRGAQIEIRAGDGGTNTNSTGGFSIELFPILRPDGFTIDISLTARLTEVVDLRDGSTLPSNPEPSSPVFAVNAVGYINHVITSNASLKDGSTLLLSESGAQFPGVTGNRSVKRYVWLVKPKVIDPAGNAVHREDQPAVPAATGQADLEGAVGTRRNLDR